MSRQKGMSLVELVTCLVVIAVIGVLSVPYLKNTLRREYLNAEVRKIYSVLHLAKREAAKRNRPVVVQFEPDNFVAFEDGGVNGQGRGDWTRQPGETIVGENHVESGMRLTTNFANNRVRFKGSTWGSGGTICVWNKDQVYARVILSPIGRIRIAK
ncbi:GspH/FimT family pseudopilin [Desulforhopalus singaporensis]|uniref:Type II secretion system protein H n=1 Tax=Desulforhopalus singaporensis TaxID=91360 RepID=A0A1H0QR21_9BACT|nr:GspH/FimT family pseudopilin [Desulforhopalus singaporensis]SDP19156.1 Type II transport protein GspH [Desulforhopalus singaporensis]